jgi:chromosome segregation ATPase
MTDYFDPNASARTAGFQHGQNEGKMQGLREGHNAGFSEGQQDGYNIGYVEGHDIGWNAAIERANAEMVKQMEFTRQHIADKEVLAQRLEEQQRLIELLTTKLDQIEQENASLKGTNTELRQVVDALRDANERLRTEVSQLDAKLKARTKEYSEHLWQYNRCAVFMNSVRCVMEDMTAEGGAQAEHVRTLFSKRYAENIEGALNKGLLRTPLDRDETLAKTMPKVAKFMADMLRKVELNGPQHIAKNIASQQPESEEHSPSM